jgi:hypothetical protein
MKTLSLIRVFLVYGMLASMLMAGQGLYGPYPAPTEPLKVCVLNGVPIDCKVSKQSNKTCPCRSDGDIGLGCTCPAVRLTVKEERGLLRRLIRIFK